MKRFVLVLLAAIAIWACNPEINPGPSSDPSRDAPASTDPSASDDPGSTDPGSADPGTEGPDFTPEEWYETNFWERTDREKMGLRGPVKTCRIFNTVYQFDREGHLVSERSSVSEKWDMLTIYSYDEKGRLIKSEMCNHVGKNEEGLPDMNPAKNPNYDWAGRDVYEYEYGNSGKFVLTEPNINGFRSCGFCNQGDPRETISPIIKDLSVIRYKHVNYAVDAVGHYDKEYVFEGDQMSVRYHSYDRELVIDWIINEYTQYDDDGNIIGGSWSGKHEGDIVADSESEYTLSDCGYKDNYPYSFMDERFGGVTSVTWADNGMPLRIEGTDGITQYYPGKRHINFKRWDCVPGKPHDALLGFSYWYEYTIDEHEDYSGYRESLMDDDSRIRQFKWYDYVYDSYGNWTQYTYDSEAIFAVGTDEKSTTTISREIEYY